MTNAQLTAFRAIAEAMQAAPADWQWIGAHMSQRMFGITEARARAYAARHGGAAQKMGCTPAGAPLRTPGGFAIPRPHTTCF